MNVLKNFRGSFGFHYRFQKSSFIQCFCCTFRDRFLKTIIEAPSLNPHFVVVKGDEFCKTI